MGTLYLVATPIGNREDITGRAVRLLREVPLIAAEDTRHTGLLLKHLGIATPLLSYHAHSGRDGAARLLAALAAGDLALVSDAGTPGLSDPGHELVVAALAAGHRVVPIPGPSALVAAVTASGMVPGPFTFLGFLPSEKAAARETLQAHARLQHPLVLYEAPHRVTATLRLALEVLGDRPAAIARELTKFHEEIRRGSLAGHLADLESTPARGELVVIIGGAAAAPPADEQAVTALLEAALAAGRGPSQAAREVAAATGRPRHELYHLALRLSRRP